MSWTVCVLFMGTFLTDLASQFIKKKKPKDGEDDEAEEQGDESRDNEKTRQVDLDDEKSQEEDQSNFSLQKSQTKQNLIEKSPPSG